MILRWLCAAIVLCASDLWGAAINGYVLNPFTQARIPGIPVAFYVRQDGQILEMLRKETDAEGHFSFSGPLPTERSPLRAGGLLRRHSLLFFDP